MGWFVAPVTVVMTCDGDWWRQRIWKKCYYASYPHIQIKRWLVWNSFLLNFIPILPQQPDTGTPLLVDLVENLGIIVKGNDCIQPRNHGSLLPPVQKLSRSCIFTQCYDIYQILCHHTKYTWVFSVWTYGTPKSDEQIHDWPGHKLIAMWGIDMAPYVVSFW